MMKNLAAHVGWMFLWAVLLAVLAGGLPGCEALGLGGSKLDEPDRVDPKAQYAGLAGQKVAVLVSADDQTLYEYPQAPQALSRVVAARLADHVPGILLTDPQQLAQFQQDNPYWTTLLPADLLRRLDVEKILLIDVSHLSTHEPGNAHVWQGLVSAEVTVYDAAAADPQQAVYRSSISAAYPPRPGITMLNSDDATVQMGTFAAFARQVGWLFYDDKGKK